MLASTRAVCCVQRFPEEHEGPSLLWRHAQNTADHLQMRDGAFAWHAKLGLGERVWITRAFQRFLEFIGGIISQQPRKAFAQLLIGLWFVKMVKV